MAGLFTLSSEKDHYCLTGLDPLGLFLVLGKTRGSASLRGSVPGSNLEVGKPPKMFCTNHLVLPAFEFVVNYFLFFKNI